MSAPWTLSRSLFPVLVLASSLAACGGGGSDGNPSGAATDAGLLAQTESAIPASHGGGLSTPDVDDTTSGQAAGLPAGGGGGGGGGQGSTPEGSILAGSPDSTGSTDPMPATPAPAPAGPSSSGGGNANGSSGGNDSSGGSSGSGAGNAGSGTTASAGSQATLTGPAGANPGSYGELTFREEWNVSALDTSKWLTRMFHWTSQELDNWRIENGVLKMWTPRDPNGNFEFNNRAMNTDGKFTQRYGWFEMEAKLPKGRGLWPSFWLYAHNDHTRPEIDILEAYGGGDEWWATADGRPIDYGATIWVSPEDGSSGDMIAHQRPGWNFEVGDLTAGFHKYGALWEPDGITFFFDGRAIGPKVLTTRLNQQMYLIVGLGTGKPGTFNAPTSQTPTTIANAYEINYVRAWALPSGTTTGGSHRSPAQ